MGKISRVFLIGVDVIVRILSDSGAHVSDGASLLFTNECIDVAFKPHNNTIKVSSKSILNSRKMNLFTGSH